MSITSAQSYEMRIARAGDKIADPPEPYWKTVELLLSDRGGDHLARLLAYRYMIWTRRKAKREFALARFGTAEPQGYETPNCGFASRH